MEQSQSSENERHTERLKRATQRSEELAKEGLSIARELHDQGSENAEHLQNAEDLAARLTEINSRVQQRTDAGSEQ